MGYTTDFWGEFAIVPALTPEHKAYLEAFATTRRMKRDPAKIDDLLDPVRTAVGLPRGIDGEYSLISTGDGMFGQSQDPSIINYNDPPGEQPGLWCQWVPNEDGTALKWDKGEKFYNYVDWLKYLIKHFLDPWGYLLSGQVEWQGEESDDRGLIIVGGANRLTVQEGELHWKNVHTWLPYGGS